MSNVSGNKIVNLEDLKVVNDRIDAMLQNNLLFDGTKERYKEVMKWWMLGNGVNVTTAAGITNLCDRWYTITRTKWNGWTEFAQPAKSASSFGTKGGDNAGMVCVPSTNTQANQDDYAGHPLFAVVDCNWTVDAETLEPVITAIDGIVGGFERTNPAKFVGVLQQSGWHWVDEKADSYINGYSAVYQGGHDSCEPIPEAVRPSDNSMRPWVVHAKYMSRTENGKLTCYAGAIPTAYSISHNTLHTLGKAIGNQYSGGCITDNAFLQLMTFIKYGAMTQDGVLQGCVNYNYQYFAKVSETGVKRVIIAKTEAANLLVGSSLLIGSYNGSSKDRNTGANYSITGNGGAVITGIEDIEVDGVTYSAVTVNTDSTFDTVAGTASGSTLISTWHWRNGSCDNVLGNDGSPYNPKDGKCAAKIQGIEYSVGGYEVYADVILNKVQSGDDWYYEPYIVNRSANQATSVTANYKASGLKSIMGSSASWTYIRKLSFGSGIFFGTDTNGGSTSTFTRDGFYKDASTNHDLREWLAFGTLDYGSGNGGLSCVYGGLTLSIAYWSILGRLSPNGNRGEWAA